MDYIVHGILQARILEWIAIPFSRGSSQPRDRTQVSHIAGGFLTSWATRERPGLVPKSSGALKNPEFLKNIGSYVYIGVIVNEKPDRKHALYQILQMFSCCAFVFVKQESIIALLIGPFWITFPWCRGLPFSWPPVLAMAIVMNVFSFILWRREWQPTLCLENPMDRGAWWAAVPGVTELGITKQLMLLLLIQKLKVSLRLWVFSICMNLHLGPPSLLLRLTIFMLLFIQQVSHLSRLLSFNSYDKMNWLSLSLAELSNPPFIPSFFVSSSLFPELYALQADSLLSEPPGKPLPNIRNTILSLKL